MTAPFRSLVCKQCGKKLAVLGPSDREHNKGREVILIERDDDALIDFIIAHENHPLVFQATEEI